MTVPVIGLGHKTFASRILYSRFDTFISFSRRRKYIYFLNRLALLETISIVHSLGRLHIKKWLLNISVSLLSIMCRQCVQPHHIRMLGRPPVLTLLHPVLDFRQLSGCTCSGSCALRRSNGSSSSFQNFR